MIKEQLELNWVLRSGINFIVERGKKIPERY